jgi:hypothetical protein
MALRLDGRNPLAYMGVTPDQPPQLLVETRQPTTNDVQNFNIGTMWVIPTQNSGPSEEVWQLVSKVGNVATWVELTSSSGTTYPDHEILIGTGTATIDTIPAGTTGYALVAQGAAADPIFDVLGVEGGGTGATSLTAYAVVCGGTTDTNPLQSIASVGSAGQPLLSNGAGMLPSFQALGVDGGGTGDTSLTAYSVLCGGTTATGSVQSVASVGTAGQVLTSNGAGMLPTFQAGDGGFTSIVTQVFDADGTYTPTAGMIYCIVEAVGGGGGSGAVVSNAGPSYGASGGGGSGAYCKVTLNAATIGASKAVTIGAGGTAGTAPVGDGGSGGDTTLGILLTAGGGSGTLHAGTSSTSYTAGGAGGTASGGDINIAGLSGSYPIISGGILATGSGGSSMYGAAPLAKIPSAGGTAGATPANGYGAGASGGSAVGISSANGGVGGGGVIIITEFIS